MTQAQSNQVTLDMGLVAKIRAESEETRALLLQIMYGDDDTNQGS